VAAKTSDAPEKKAAPRPDGAKAATRRNRSRPNPRASRFVIRVCPSPGRSSRSAIARATFAASAPSRRRASATTERSTARCRRQRWRRPRT
jgi:hypothetical protein